MTIDLIARRDATQRTMDKFRDRPFDWAARSTCLHLAAYHLRQLGHRAPPVPAIRSLLGAKRAMTKRGWADVGEMLAGIGLLEIPPATMIVGDLAVLQSDSDGIGAITISVGGKVMGWHEDSPLMQNIEPLQIDRAFRG